MKWEYRSHFRKHSRVSPQTRVVFIEYSVQPSWTLSNLGADHSSRTRWEARFDNAIPASGFPLQICGFCRALSAFWSSRTLSLFLFHAGKPSQPFSIASFPSSFGSQHPFRERHQSRLSICNGDSLCPSRFQTPHSLSLHRIPRAPFSRDCVHGWVSPFPSDPCSVLLYDITSTTLWWDITKSFNVPGVSRG